MAIPKRTIASTGVFVVLIGLTSPVPGIASGPLPQNILIDTNVYQFVQRFLLAKPIQIDTAAYEALLRMKSVGQQTTTKEKTTVRVLRPDLIEERTVSEMSIRVNGQSMNQKIQTVAYSTGDGFIPLGSRTTSQNRFGKSTSDNKIIKIEMSGNLFPIAVGNRFAYRIVGRSSTRSQQAKNHVYNDVFTSKLSCKITRRFEAKSFHVNLTGAAYVVQCDGQTLSKNSPSASWTGELKSVYFDALGIFIKADPIDSQPNIINNVAPSVTGGKYKFVTKGAYRLKSFSLSSTLICLHPIFAEEVKLLGQLDGNRSTTNRIAGAMINMREKYCRLVHEVPKSDAKAELNQNCVQYTGMFRGERVYWGACYG